ncbi:MAG: hypothetical protein WCD18_13255 [Thermosynechococcaceae cyanobacterium]
MASELSRHYSSEFPRNLSRKIALQSTLKSALQADPQSCLQRLTQVTTGNYGWSWDWTKANISVSLLLEESKFWLTAMLSTSNDLSPKALVKVLHEKVYPQSFTLEDFMKAVTSEKGQFGSLYKVNLHTLHPEIVLPHINYFFEEIVVLTQPIISSN